MKPENQPKPLKPIRRPTQSRSINTKERILDAALDVFCDKGYYKTTTNQIAQQAGVSIGSLYAYFKDKDTIFLEVLERYHAKFDIAKSKILSDDTFYGSDPRAWLRKLIEALVQVHEETRALNRELNVLSYYDAHICEILEGYRAQNMRAAVGYFIEKRGTVPLQNAEATITVLYDLISATVDRIVFGKNQLAPRQLIDATADIIYQYVFAAKEPSIDQRTI